MPSEVLLATPVAGASDYRGLIITNQPAVLFQLDCPINFFEIYVFNLSLLMGNKENVELIDDEVVSGKPTK